MWRSSQSPCPDFNCHWLSVAGTRTGRRKREAQARAAGVVAPHDGPQWPRGGRAGAASESAALVSSRQAASCIVHWKVGDSDARWLACSPWQVPQHQPVRRARSCPRPTGYLRLRSCELRVRDWTTDRGSRRGCAPGFDSEAGPPGQLRQAPGACAGCGPVQRTGSSTSRIPNPVCSPSSTSGS